MALAAQIPVLLGWDKLDPAWFRAVVNDPDFGDYLAARHAAEMQTAAPLSLTEAE